LVGGALLVLMGILRFGRYVVFIPTPVITGFTCGIALIIGIGQIDASLGISTPPADTGLLKILGYLNNHPTINSAALICTVATMVLIWVFHHYIPKIPDALGAMIIMTLVSWLLGWDVVRIGTLPATILLADHLNWSAIPWQKLSDIVSAGVSIAALAAIESLMTGTAGAAMSGKSFDPDQELIAQGGANIVMPWFGGVPSSAAISRTAVAIRSGAHTRLTSIFHSIALMLSVLFLGNIIAYVPLACLAGVLLWTAWHMCDWPTLTRYVHARLKHAIAGVVVTMLATAALDLTQAILIGLAVSAIIHLRLEADAASVTVVPVDPARLPNARFTTACAGVRVGSKGMYKSEPVVADGGEVVIYAPHLHEVSVVHGKSIREIGYHVRDYFLGQWEKFAHVPNGVIAHSTHLRGVGTWHDGVERPRITVTLATGISREECQQLNLNYADYRTIDPQRLAAGDDSQCLVIPRAGEFLYRLRER
jgi:SulP family sulfate permease